jgi:predicted RNA binding protein YcfA (HicA-like mRNA interferase family)
VKFRGVIEILTDNGFVLHRHSASSHRRFRGVVDGQVRYVDVAAHSMNDDVKPGTLASIIRQSG